MLKLTYTRESDEFSTVTVLGDAAGIRDLFWQLTHYYRAVDGMAIGRIMVTTLDGLDITTSVFKDAVTLATRLSTSI